MKFLLLLPMLLFSWDFTRSDYERILASNPELISVSHSVGAQHNLGDTLVALAIVETFGGLIPDTNSNSICGPHQIDINFVDYSGTPEVFCKAIEDNPYLSASLALANFQFWLRNSTHSEAVRHYNAGNTFHSHSPEYLRRFRLALSVIQSY